jgi:single-strand DNA-binding protein
MNKAVLMGRLTKDPDVRYTQDAQPMCIARYTLAVDRRGKKDGQQTADFISCVAFGKVGEFTEKYLHKGMKICVAGRIQTGSYTRQDGTKVYTTDVVVEGQEFCEGRSANDVAHNYSTPSPQSSGTSAALDGFMNIPEGIDDELPFN